MNKMNEKYLYCKNYSKKYFGYNFKLCYIKANVIQNTSAVNYLLAMFLPFDFKKWPLLQPPSPPPP